MIRITHLQDKHVAVFGLARSGIIAARALIDGGTQVSAWDDTPASRDAAVAAGIPVVDLSSADWSTFANLILSPGVPLTHPEPHWTVKLAAAASVPVIGDIELFLRERQSECPGAPLIVITGTNGKSTTTALIAHILRELGITVEMGGNIGVGVLSLAPAAVDRVHVLELSSFQIDLTPSIARVDSEMIGVLLNVTPDHLDRHGTLEHYASVKERLITGASIACVGADDDITRAIIERRRAAGRPVYPFTAGRGSGIVPRVYAIGDTLFLHTQSGAYASSTAIASLAGIGTLRGQHNVQNAAAALTAIKALADRLADDPNSPPSLWQPERIAAALKTYPGLPHRMEEVGRLPKPGGEVLVINDSKATNADSTEKALASFAGAIHWILGGKAKEGGIANLTAFFPRIAKAYLIGEAADAFAATFDGHVPFERSGTLDVALSHALADAAASGAPEPVVLLSPACASYDQFKSFEQRGDVFRDLARAAGAEPAGHAL